MNKILTITIALLAAASISGTAVAQTQPTPQSSMRKNLQNHDLHNTEREVFQSEVSLEAGASFPRHSHPGEEFIYVLKGTWVYQFDGQPPITVKAGETLFIPYGAVHSAKNVGGETGIELATHVIEKGKPLLTLANEEQK
ncbi:Cupin domain-containing protein [Mesorhizobium albiziae]|uniref:Cupin domain-containing protein n=1 Tax=Neomesorhizobium albiziae TaxID=335020 RepID=A0A1I4CBY2_9HYPH|nr:cupin domain-containing protein [Mesorhizobium albiziae]GLS29546.1 cupin [Mesorhizobium albiziae]SFK78455.1 Cupin domain-containing protein [Mesorhizobium albiziae]